MADLDYLPWCQPGMWADRPCVRDSDMELTYAQVRERVDAIAEQLQARGVGPGDVVAVMLPNRVELILVLMAAWRLGGTATPINPAFTRPEAEHQIVDANASVVVTLNSRSPCAGRDLIAVDDLARQRTGRLLPEPDTQLEDLALLIYTSGSTGRPKGVMLSHANVDAMSATFVDTFSVTEADHCLLILPLFHANALFGSFLTPIRVGAQLSIMSRFRPDEFLTHVERLRPTYFSAVPTIYGMLASDPKISARDLSSLRYAICGAAPASRAVLETAERLLRVPIVEGYGLTEASCASTCNPLDGPRKPGTVGLPLRGQRVEIMGPDGNILPRGQRGEVVIQGPTVMLGYLNQPAATAEALGDGWLHTGDVGILDDDGYLRLVDRIKDIIIRGGENIYPKEIETVLERFPGILEAAVIGVPDERLGEVPVALVTMYPGLNADIDDLMGACSASLARSKLPVVIRQVAELPKNAVGKIDKPALRSQQKSERVSATQGA